MIANVCPRCSNKFYTAVTGADIPCPYCGFSFKNSGPDKRKENRVAIQRDCDISRQETTVTVKAMDISMKGICVTAKWPLPFKTDESLHVVIKGFDIDRDASVVWTKDYDDGTFKAGLRFR